MTAGCLSGGNGHQVQPCALDSIACLKQLLPDMRSRARLGIQAGQCRILLRLESRNGLLHLLVDTLQRMFCCQLKTSSLWYKVCKRIKDLLHCVEERPLPSQHLLGAS